jgi:hypothetical protein
MKKILILGYSNFSNDPRIIRQAEALSEGFEVYSLGVFPFRQGDNKFHKINTNYRFSFFRKLKRLKQFIFKEYDDFYWDEYRKAIINNYKDINFYGIVSNDIQTLPLALKISKGKSLVYFDAHEFHPKEFEGSFMWRLFHRPYVEYLTKKYIPYADFFSTVSGGISNLYFDFLKIKPIVITNSCGYYNLMPSSLKSKVRIIHHGAAIKERKLELMIEAYRMLPEDYELHFMLIKTDNKYYDQLKRYSKDIKGIYFHEPVAFNSIVSFINQFDIGLFALSPDNTNYYYALPNKIFEFIQARLAIVTTPNLEMRSLIENYDLGKVSLDYSPLSISQAIIYTSRNLTKFKSNVNKAAEIINSDNNKKVILKMFS